MEEKKVVARDVLYQELAELLINSDKKETVTRYKEGLRLEVEGETCIIRVIQKKAAPTNDLIVGEYEKTEEGEVIFVDFRELKKEE